MTVRDASEVPGPVTRTARKTAAKTTAAAAKTTPRAPAVIAKRAAPAEQVSILVQEGVQTNERINHAVA